MAKEKVREIPRNNYFKALVLIICSVVLIFYIAKWYGVYQEDNLNKAIISDYLEELNYDEFQNYLIENPNTVVYMGIAKDEECRIYENTFKNIVDNYNLKDSIIYVNITDFSQNSDYINMINDMYKTKKVKLTSIPAILVFENGELVSVLNNNLTKDKTVVFLKKYEVIN